MCYVGAIRDLVRNILAGQAHLTRLARQYNCLPQQLDRRGVFAIPLHDPQRTFLASLILTIKSHQDRAHSNKAWAKLLRSQGYSFRVWPLEMLSSGDFGLDAHHLEPPPFSGQMRTCSCHRRPAQMVQVIASYSCSLTPPVEFQMLPVHMKQGV